VAPEKPSHTVSYRDWAAIRAENKNGRFAVGCGTSRGGVHRKEIFRLLRSELGGKQFPNFFSKNSVRLRLRLYAGDFGDEGFGFCGHGDLTGQQFAIGEIFAI
jgi:hypothetical protein